MYCNVYSGNGRTGAYEEFSGDEGDLHLSFDSDNATPALRSLEEVANNFYCHCPSPVLKYTYKLLAKNGL